MAAHTPGCKIEQHKLGVDAFDFSLNLSDPSETCVTSLRLAPKTFMKPIYFTILYPSVRPSH